MMRRFEVRPIPSRRLRAALFLLGLLSILALAQTRLTGWVYGLALGMLLVLLAVAWRHMVQAVMPLLVSFRPLEVSLLQPSGEWAPGRCVSLSVYPWLIVLKVRPVPDLEQSAPRLVLLLPDSLLPASEKSWRQILVWAQQMRRQIGSGQKRLSA